MNRVLFSHSYFMRYDPKQWETGQPYAPLGTLYAASLLRENGYEVDLFDTMFLDSPELVIEKIKTMKPDFFVVYDDGFNYLTKLCLTNMREAAFRMCKIARENGCVVIVSSSDSTDHYEQYLSEGANFVIIGEAEHTLLELTNTLSNKETAFQNIQGLAYYQNNCLIKTQRRTVLKDLDSLPLPAWDLVNILPYKKMWKQHYGYFSINIGTTRGCPFKCNWCAKPIYGNRYNSRSPENVIKEIVYLKERFQFEHIWFCDDIFGLKPGWVQEFAALVNKARLVFKFKIQSRVDLLVQDNYVRSLSLAGCDNVWMGAESGSQKILDAMDKGTTIGQIEAATQLLKENHIKPSFFIQFGYLGETKEDIELTIRMINRLLPHSIGISVSYPLPGTVFYEKVKASMHTKTNWTDSDELALLFSNTYQPEFYKQLHGYVHKTYRSHLAVAQIKNIFRKPTSINLLAIRKALSVFYYLPASIITKFKINNLQKV